MNMIADGYEDGNDATRLRLLLMMGRAMVVLYCALFRP